MIISSGTRLIARENDAEMTSEAKKRDGKGRAGRRWSRELLIFRGN